MSGQTGRGQQAPAAAGAAGATLVKDATSASFSADVIAESARQPVLVDFWAPWCEPCKQLGPILEKVVRAAEGKVKLVKMDIDKHPDIPSRLGVRSIPAVFAFQRGQPVDGFMGALPESQVKAFVERLVGPLDDRAELLKEAEAALAAGDAAGAAEIYGALRADDEGNIAAAAGLAKALVALGEGDEAKKVLDGLPAAAARDPAVAAARAVLDLSTQAASVGDVDALTRQVEAAPADHQARFDLAIALNAHGRRTEAADALLHIVKHDRGWNDDGARKQLLQFFDAWSAMDPATLAARRKLSGFLFS